jgi:hypothetical protein
MAIRVRSSPATHTKKKVADDFRGIDFTVVLALGRLSGIFAVLHFASGKFRRSGAALRTVVLNWQAGLQK